MSSSDSTPDAMQKLFGFVDANREKFIQTLAEAVEIKSVSAWPETREVIRITNEEMH